jgi:hypothetical protein
MVDTLYKPEGEGGIASASGNPLVRTASTASQKFHLP